MAVRAGLVLVYLRVGVLIELGSQKWSETGALF